MSRVLGVIPARLGSSRLPRKPLQPLLGKPLVLWVWERACRMDVLHRVLIATDSDEVAEVCRDAGAEVAMTSSRHETGSDRVWEVARRFSGRFDVVVNIQCDEPLVEPATVAAAVAMVENGFEAGTCATAVRDAGECRDPSVVKVVRGADGGALYFSRAVIPHVGDGAGGRRPWLPGRHLRHVGIYAYRPEALGRWVGFERSELEVREGLEQLRALENGMRIGVALVAEAAAGVDTPRDLDRMERLLRSLGYGPGGVRAGAGGETAVVA